MFLKKYHIAENSRKVIVPKISDKTENTANNKTITEGNILQKLEEPATNIFQNDNEYESK